jgi:hypothetical protein
LILHVPSLSFVEPKILLNLLALPEEMSDKEAGLKVNAEENYELRIRHVIQPLQFPPMKCLIMANLQ